MNMMALALALLLQQDLIRQLGADDYATREEATAKLVEMGRAALPALREAAAAERDEEVRVRIQQIVRHLTELRWHSDLATALQAAREADRPLLVYSTIGALNGFT